MDDEKIMFRESKSPLSIELPGEIVRTGTSEELSLPILIPHAKDQRASSCPYNAHEPQRTPIIPESTADWNVRRGNSVYCMQFCGVTIAQCPAKVLYVKR